MDISYAERMEHNNEYYSLFYNNLKNRTEKRNYCELLPLFKNNLPPANGLILDVGAGLGMHLPMLKKEGQNVIGIEPCSKLRELAQADHLQMMEGSFEELDEMHFDQPVNGFWCAASFIHVPKEEALRVLKTMRRMLAEGGCLFITTRTGSKAYWDSYDAQQEQSAQRFMQLYGDTELTALITDAGFEMIYERIEDSYWGRKAKWISLLAKAI